MVFDEKFWIALSTAAFVLLVFKPVKKLLTQGLDSRATRIKHELDEALRLKEEAQALLASYQRKQKQALEESRDIINHAKAESDRIISSAREKVERELARRTELAMQKIAMTEAQVIQEIRNNAVDITVSTARGLIMERMNDETANELMHSAVKEIERKVH